MGEREGGREDVKGRSLGEHGHLFALKLSILVIL